MKLRHLALAASVGTAVLAGMAQQAYAQAKGTVLPGAGLPRTGAYALTAVPFANATASTISNSSTRGGITASRSPGRCGDRLRHRPCVGERLRGKAAVTVFQPLSPASPSLSPKAPADKIPLITAGVTGAPTRPTGMVFKWNFPIAGTQIATADVLVQHIAKKGGRLRQAQGKRSL